MRGTVLHFSIKTNQGVISGDDGKRYTFDGSCWNLDTLPNAGIRVDFDAHIDQAVSIYKDPTSAAPKSPKSRLPAGLLAILLGGFGVHFFYLESWGWGLISLLFCWTYIPAIVGIVLGIRYLLMSDEEFDRKVSSIHGPFDVI